VQPGAQTLSSTSSATSATATPKSSATAVPEVQTHDHHLSAGAIAGISIGAAAVVLLCAALFYFVGRSRTYGDVIKQQAQLRSEGGVPSNTGGSNAGGTSTVGEHPVGQWSPNRTPVPNNGNWENRYSQQTAVSQMTAVPVSGTFVGYNRHTGEPEFATEAPGSDVKDEKPRLQASTPSPTYPPAVRNSPQATPYELPGTLPSVAEAGPDR
jgi:hypothetical protein